MIKVAINGFGRIGRVFFRQAFNNSTFEIVAINDITDPATLAHLLKYDSVHGIYDKDVSVGDKSIIVDGKEITIYSERDPAQLPWSKLGIEVVVESTGLFRTREKASLHFKAGAKRVIISAPANDPDKTVVLGVNSDAIDKEKDLIISNASCTTNCLAPMVKILHDNYKIINGFMTTIHSYTNDQKLLDLPHGDLRRARAAAQNIIPTSTGAAKAIGIVVPELNGKLDGISVRVPTANVSLTDLVVSVEKETTVQEINSAMKKASENELKGILQYTETPLVSGDYNGNPHSVIFDALETKVMEGKTIKLLGWYDNETGYSTRLKDLIEFIYK